MKKRALLIPLILLAPLLMANSPSPEIHPKDYTSYQLTGESIVISEKESAKYITFSGVLQNTGDGIISSMNSHIVYHFEDDDLKTTDIYFEDDRPSRGLLPDQSCSFEQILPYTGSASVGAVTYISRTIRMYAYQDDDIIQTIAISNQSITSGEYDESNDDTRFKYSFNWTNSGQISSQTIFVSFTIGDKDYLDYHWKSISKNSTGHTDLYLTVDGDVSSENPENINLFFIRRAYEDRDWGFFTFLFSDNLIIFGIVITMLMVVAPIIIAAIVLLVVNKKK